MLTSSVQVHPTVWNKKKSIRPT